MSAPASRARTLTVLALATGVHALSASTLFVIPAIAPEVAEAMGISTALVGMQVSVVYLGATLMSVFAGGLAVRYGGARASQIGLLFGVLGLALASWASVSAFVVASLLLGLGYGMINPPTGQMLEAVATSRTRGLLFSTKQTAVPLGGIIAGLVGPPSALLWGWQAALWVTGGCALATIGLLQLLMTRFPPSPRAVGSVRQPLFRDVHLIWRGPTLRWATIAACAMAGVQFTLTTFLVTLLVEDVGFDLVAAGIGLSVFQAAALCGRVLWGLVADITHSGLIVLLIAFLLAMVALLPLTFMTPGWSGWVLYPCLAALGAAGAGWNGVFVSEVVRLAPSGTAARAIGGAFVFTFGGALFAPTLFSLLFRLTDTYTVTVWMLVGFAAVGAGSASLAILKARATPA
jgi:MFS family permease